MPSRGPRARASKRSRAKASQENESRKAPSTGEDVWDEVMDMKSGGGKANDGEFNKMNTLFYLREDDGEVDIVVLDENPVVFWSHTIKCQTDDGRTFYRTEQCQKSESESCIMCDSNSKAIGKSRKTIAFRILDSRGAYDSEIKGFDGEPAPKIFLTPLYLAKQLKTLKQDGDGISDKVVKLKKESQYQANLKMEKGKGGAMFYVEAPEYDEELPDILDVYAPMDDDDLIDFIDNFADATPAPRANNRRAGKKTGFGN